MLCPATPNAIERLARAAIADDRELDAALTGLGVLPPLDLDLIRTCLCTPHTKIAAGVNRDGHRLIAVVDGDSDVAWIHHDGQVVLFGRQLVDSTTDSPSS